MKKILFINGSFQNAACMEILESIQQNFWLEYSTEILSLRDYNLEQCTGCMHCFKNSECLIEDKFKLVREKIEDSDLVVVATPTYFYSVSGYLKTFIDRTRAMLKNGSLNNKKFIFVYCTYHNTDTIKSFLDTAVQGFNHSHHIHHLASFSVSIDENQSLVSTPQNISVVKEITNIISTNL